MWQSGLWLPASASTDSDGATAWTYPAGTPIYPARRSWHSADGIADAFWGPSIHWNTYLRQYVMLLNHTSTVAFNQEGIYVGFSARLDDPGSWTAPQKVLSGGGWYPEVLGLDPASGTDKEARGRRLMRRVAYYKGCLASLSAKELDSATQALAPKVGPAGAGGGLRPLDVAAQEKKPGAFRPRRSVTSNETSTIAPVDRDGPARG